MEKAILQLETLSCPSCMQKIEGALKSVNGIDKDSIKVLFNSSKVKINFDSAVTSIEEIQKAIENVGYPVLKAKVKSDSRCLETIKENFLNLIAVNFYSIKRGYRYNCKEE